MERNNAGLDDEEIIEILSKANPSLNSGNARIERLKSKKTGRSLNTPITVTSDGKTDYLIEKALLSTKEEIRKTDLLRRRYNLPIPRIYHLDPDRGVILTEDLNTGFIQGSAFDEETENGKFIRSNYTSYLEAAARFHAEFWENEDAFRKIGLPWHLENFQVHMRGLEKNYLRYKAEYKGRVNPSDLQCFDDAISDLRDNYPDVISERFHSGKNITIIHGDLHPGNIFISPVDMSVKFIDFEAVRMGLCTDDLAMIVAYHIAPDKKDALPLLDHYYNCLSRKVDEYSYDEFKKDYITSIIENMFFSIRLINQGIPAFNIRDNSLVAYNTFRSENISD